MGKRIKLTKTDVFLLGLTVLFVLAMALTWLLTPRQVRGGYDISAVPPEETAPALLKVNINLSLIHIRQCPRIAFCRSPWSP